MVYLYCMIMRNGIKSNLRAGKRTVIFIALILSLVILFSLGLGMWNSSQAMLRQCDEAFVSVASFEYMGAYYPDANEPDEFARAAALRLDPEAIEKASGVTYWESTNTALADMEGFQRISGYMPYRDYAVITVSSLQAPSYRTEWIPVEEGAALPSSYILEDSNTFYLYVYEAGQLVQTVPYFVEDYNNDALVYRTLEKQADGSYAEASFSLAELPEAFRFGFCLPGEGLYEDDPYYLEEDVKYGIREGTLIYAGSSPIANERELPFYRQTVENTLLLKVSFIASYVAVLDRNLYNRTDMEGILFNLELNGVEGLEPQKGKKYLIHGKFVTSAGGNRTFSLVDFYEGCETDPYYVFDSYDDPMLSDSLFTEYAEIYRKANNYTVIEAARDIPALPAFQQNGLTLAEGRFPESGEAGVCLVSGLVKDRMGLSLGDKVTVKILDSSEDNRFVLSDTEDKRQLEIVGFSSAVKDYDGYIWVSEAEGNLNQPLYGYTLGFARLDNRQSRQAAEILQQMAPDQVRVTLLDQGYSTAAQPLETMRTTALAITFASGAGVLSVLILFAITFIWRQKETVHILSAFGTAKPKIALWFLSGAFVIVAPAALAGTVMGGLLLHRVSEFALESFRGLYSAAPAYSEAAIGMVKEIRFVETQGGPVLIAGAVAIVMTALLLCFIALRMIHAGVTVKRGVSRVRVPGGTTSVWGRGSLRYAWLSVRRNGARSVVVPVAAFVLAMLVILFSGLSVGWVKQMDTLYDETEIQGQFTSTNGQLYSDLVLNPKALRFLWNTGMLSELNISLGWPYFLEREIPAFGSSSFGQESREIWISEQPKLIALNDISAAPEFYYADANITWLAGYDESIFRGNAVSAYYEYEDTEPVPAIIDRDFAADHGLQLGDFLAISFHKDKIDFPTNLMVAGFFNKMGSGANIYVPLAFCYDPEWLLGEEDVLTDLDQSSWDSYYFTEADWEEYSRIGRMISTTFQTCRFTLKSARDLENFRRALFEGRFSQVGTLRGNRLTVVLRDSTFNETVAGLNRYIAFADMLIPILLAMVGLVGFIVSWLMINGRKMEFAMMRGLGVSRLRVFMIFFTEQLMLCLAGCVPAVIWLAILGGTGRQWLMVGGFFVCYMLGTVLSILLLGRVRLLQLLSERE